MSLHLFNSITTFVFDVDGVLTDGTLFLFPDGEMVRRMNIKDGYAMQLAVKQGYNVIIISGGQSEPVKTRLNNLGISEVFMGVKNKTALLQQKMMEHNLSSAQILYMGDDIPDVDAMSICGLPCCPADACTQVKAISDYISPMGGGSGCVRDVIEKVMTLQGKWQHDVAIASK